VTLVFYLLSRSVKERKKEEKERSKFRANRCYTTLLFPASCVSHGVDPPASTLQRPALRTSRVEKYFQQTLTTLLQGVF
jgi:hypothetical protein